jgi:hypothetical protein
MTLYELSSIFITQLSALFSWGRDNGDKISSAKGGELVVEDELIS